MDTTARRPAWRLLVAPILATGLLFGWLAYSTHGHGDASAPRHLGAAPAKPTLNDIILAATTATQGISLEYDGVTGPPSSDHTNHAAVSSFRWGVSRAISLNGLGRGVGKPSVSEIVITKRLDKYSAKLLLASLTGGAKNAVLYFTAPNAKGAPVDYLVIKLTNVLISSYSESSGGAAPSETLSLNFTKVEFQYKVAGTSDTVIYDLTTVGAVAAKSK